jgi:hypothetical protein
MIRSIAPLAAAAFALAACDGNPFGAGGPTPPTPPSDDPEIAARLRQNVAGAAFDPATGTLRVDLRSLDGTPVSATYARTPALDTNGFLAYTAQETSSQRLFLALVRRGAAGATEALTVADGGQFANSFGGGTYQRLGAFTMPGSGLASYSGGYVGLLNTGATVPGPGPGFDPQQSFRVTGEMLLNADFNAGNAAVNGAVRNRQVVETGAALPDVFLWVAEVNPDGRFQGSVRLTPSEIVGDYGGTFGGLGASEVAGVMVFNPIPGERDLREHGAFVLPRCAPGDPPPCP